MRVFVKVRQLFIISLISFAAVVGAFFVVTATLGLFGVTSVVDQSDCVIFYEDDGSGGPNAVMALDFCQEGEGVVAPGCISPINEPHAQRFYENYLQYHRGTCKQISGSLTPEQMVLLDEAYTASSTE